MLKKFWNLLWSLIMNEDINFCGPELLDERIQLPDAKGLLADMQIRPYHFEILNREVCRFFPEVSEIRIRTNHENRMTVSFYFDNYSKNLVRSNLNLADEFQRIFEPNSPSYLFLPPPLSLFPGEFVLYDKSTYLDSSLT